MNGDALLYLVEKEDISMIYHTRTHLRNHLLSPEKLHAVAPSVQYQLNRGLRVRWRNNAAEHFVSSDCGNPLRHVIFPLVRNRLYVGDVEWAPASYGVMSLLIGYYKVFAQNIDYEMEQNNTIQQMICLCLCLVEVLQVQAVVMREGINNCNKIWLLLIAHSLLVMAQSTTFPSACTRTSKYKWT